MAVTLARVTWSPAGWDITRLGIDLDDDAEELLQQVAQACRDAGHHGQLPVRAPGQMVPWEQIRAVLQLYAQLVAGPGRRDHTALQALQADNRVLPQAGIGRVNVPLGYLFRHRKEMYAIGLHPQDVRGIGLAPAGGTLLAAAVCADARNLSYVDTVGLNRFYYEGQATSKFCEPNLGMMRSMVWNAVEVRMRRLVADGTLEVQVTNGAGPRAPIRVMLRQRPTYPFEYLGIFHVEKMQYTPATLRPGKVTCVLTP